MPKRILVVDDDPNIVNLIRAFLTKIGFEIMEANDGLDGLQKARTEKPDLIILDVMLPKLDGFKLSRLLKFDETFQNTPILMLTAKSDEKDERTGKAMGADAYLTKPFKNQQLIDQVKALVA
ncbi:MAG: response regulator transcription factor [Fidelibacterota bacterium]